MERIKIEEALCGLGATLKAYLQGDAIPGRYDFRDGIDKAVVSAKAENPWFTETNVRYSFQAWADALQPDTLKKWLKPYPKDQFVRLSKTVAVIMAGNIPLVGMHDFISVLLAGHKVLVKLSGDDAILLPLMAEIIFEYEPGLKGRVRFTHEVIQGFDAVIATGSDNTYRYFDYYFGKYPSLLRKNRISVAVLTGSESLKNLDDLCDDVLTYFGMGCRSVSKLFVPEGYDFDGLLTLFNAWDDVGVHHQYRNNYDYQKSIFIINKIPFIDHRNILLTASSSLKSPLSVLHYETYTSPESVNETLKVHRDEIQCVATLNRFDISCVPYGRTQKPALWDYPDGKDTLAFLLHL
jgi:hypothetical protein